MNTTVFVAACSFALGVAVRDTAQDFNPSPLPAGEATPSFSSCQRDLSEALGLLAHALTGGTIQASDRIVVCKVKFKRES